MLESIRVNAITETENEVTMTDVNSKKERPRLADLDFEPEMES